MVSFYESLEVKLNGLGIFLDSERILMHIAIALARGEFKGLVVRERDPSRCASLNLRCCSVRDSSRFSVLASTRNSVSASQEQREASLECRGRQ